MCTEFMNVLLWCCSDLVQLRGCRTCHLMLALLSDLQSGLVIPVAQWQNPGSRGGQSSPPPSSRAGSLTAGLKRCAACLGVSKHRRTKQVGGEIFCFARTKSGCVTVSDPLCFYDVTFWGNAVP